MRGASGEAAFDFFLVHASPHKPEARALHAALAARSRVFLDESSLPAGAIFDTEIPRALEAARVIVVIVGPRDDGAHYQRAEIQRALRRLREGTGVVVPVLLEGVEPGSAQIPYGLERSHALRMRPGEEAAVARQLLDGAAAPRRERPPRRRALALALALAAALLLTGAAVLILRPHEPESAIEVANHVLALWDRADVDALWDRMTPRAQSMQTRALAAAQLQAVRQGYGGPVTQRTRVLTRTAHRHPVTLAPTLLDQLRFEAIAPVGTVCEEVWLWVDEHGARHLDVFTAQRAAGPHCDGETELGAAEAMARRFADALARSEVQPADERWFTALRVSFDRQDTGHLADRLLDAIRDNGPYAVQSQLLSALTSQSAMPVPRLGSFAMVALEISNPLGARSVLRVVLERAGDDWRVDYFDVNPLP